MAIHLYNRDKSKTYQLMDKQIKSYIHMGGGLFHIYKLLSVIDSKGEAHPIEELKLSDDILMENSGRKYSKTSYDIYGVTKMNTSQFSFTALLMPQNDSDVKELYLHYNEMIARIGRKLVYGDVVEFSFLRDIDLLDNSAPINKFYYVIESVWDDGAWSPLYANHIWKLKLKPIVNSPEFADLYNDPDDGGDAYGGGEGISSNNSDEEQELTIMNNILDEAEDEVPFRNVDQHHLYVDEDYKPYLETILYHGDGIPANVNADDVKIGMFFPDPKEVSKGDYFLRIDYDPPRLYVREENQWRLIEVDNRQAWTGFSREVVATINNEETYTDEVTNKVETVRRNLKDLVKARVSKEHNAPRPWNDIAIKKF